MIAFCYTLRRLCDGIHPSFNICSIMIGKKHFGFGAGTVTLGWMQTCTNKQNFAAKTNKMNSLSLFAALVVLVCSCIVGEAFRANSFSYASHSRKQLKVKPLHENFFLDIAEDPAVNTPKQVNALLSTLGW